MFGHPYEPYDVQKQFMDALYTALSSSDVGIFESPTGTGKTLSLLCPSLAWLRNAPERKLEADLAAIDSSGGPQWVRDAAKKMKRDEFAAKKRKREEENIDNMKIFFVSRTHSQLSQVAGALKQLKTVPPSFVTLGSRKQLCINSEVTGTTEQMNEKCTELVKLSKCAFKTNTEPLKDAIASQILDIEELAQRGRAEHACPYYAAREALPNAEIVAVPYPLLLVEQNRETLNIDLQNAVVIVDEAHNLVDTLTQLHSAVLSLEVVERAQAGMSLYLQLLGARMGPDTKRKVMQISRLVESIQHYFTSVGPMKPGSPLQTSDLLAYGNAYTLDFSDLSAFASQSHLVFKVESYSKKVTGAGPANALGLVLQFVLVSTNPLLSGRLYHDLDEQRKLLLRYLVLDPKPLFSDIVEHAQCVILAGGTMEPMSEFTTYLLPESAMVGKHSYGHIVPKENLLVVTRGNDRFTFANRSDPRVIANLAETMLEIVKTTPHGVVTFFPGYGYLGQVVMAWKKSGVLDKLKQYKAVFCETRNATSDVFSEYAKHVDGKGALLLAVVGGRLSEGINFSDDLARAVVMVGLPFPNAMSAEMVAKRRFIEQSSIARGESAEGAKENARQYYENLAMRAVNQSVGRAIRHIADFAAIYLIDARYKLPEFQQKLSKWVRDNIAKDVSEQRIQEFWDRHKKCK